MSVQITPSTTPNENAMKYTLSCPAIDTGYKTFANAEAAEESPVAKALFAIDGVAQVFLMADFVTITKKVEANWSDMESSVLAAIQSSYS